MARIRTSRYGKYIAFIVPIMLILLIPLFLPIHAKAENPTAPDTSPTPTTQPTMEGSGSAKPAASSLLYLPMLSQPFISSSIPMNMQPPEPIIVQQSPVGGEELAPDGSITLTFDRDIEQASFADAFQLLEVPSESDSSSALQSDPTPVEGTFAWSNGTTVIFQPDQPLKRGTTYDILLSGTISASDGTKSNQHYRSRFTTAGYLQVSQVIPDDSSIDIERDSDITIFFNRPVVPMKKMDQQDTLPQPVEFTPAIAGSGKWLNTSIYLFQPSGKLQENTTYTGKVTDTLTDVTGNPMQGGYTWSFTTLLPPAVQVETVLPSDGDTGVSVEPVIRIRFNQPVEGASARDAFSVQTDNGTQLDGDMSIVEDTITFTPSQRLAFEQEYQIIVEGGVESSDDGRPMQTSYTSTFTTVPLPRILSTNPYDGESNVRSYQDFSIYFNAPIDADTVLPNITITPPVSPTNMSTYFSTYSNRFDINFAMLASTSYTVHIGPDIADPYGNTTGQTMDVHFQTAPLEPERRLMVPGTIATYNANKPIAVRVQSANVLTAPMRLYQLSRYDLFDRYYLYGYSSPDDATLIRSWDAPIAGPPNTTVDTRVKLAEDGGTLAPGIYLVQLERHHSSYYYYAYDYHILVVSPINLTLKAGEKDALVWANDLQTGDPVSGMEIDFFDQDMGKLGTATTDSEGIAKIEIDRISNEGVIAIAREPFAATSSEWDYGVSASDFGLPANHNLPEMTAHIYTERPIYRPDQTVYFKGVLRAENDAQFSLPSGLNSVSARITDAAGEEIFDDTLQVNQNGTFHSSINLPAEAALGEYTLQVETLSQTFYERFRVAEYRVPEFEVAVVPQAKEVVRGSPIQATVAVSYFFGLPVQDAPVEWTAKVQDYHIEPDWAARYQFRNVDDPWYCWYCWWMPGVEAETILEGQGTTDAQGNVHITLPKQLRYENGDPITQSVRLTIEAIATGKDNQVISNQSDIVVHGSDVYVGLDRQPYIGQATKEQQIDVVTVDSFGKPLPNQPVLIEIYQQRWQNYYWEDEGRWTWEIQRTSVFSGNITTDAQGLATLHYVPQEGGSYRVEAHTQDSSGQDVSASIFLWVTGEGYMTWRRDNNDRITLIADKTTFTVGETAKIFIPSPYQHPHWALITVERGGTLSYEVVRMEGNSTIYEVPITEEHIPNVYVSVVLLSSPSDASIYGSPTPTDYKVGVLALDVAPDPKTLSITLKPDVQEAEPGQLVRYDVTVTDQQGDPVEAELSLDLIDKAVLSLMPRTPQAILKAFFSRRGLGVVTASGIALAADRNEEEEPEEDDSVVEDDPLSPQPTAMPGNPPPEAKEPPTFGDGEEKDDRNDQEEGGGSGDSNSTIRQEFSDTAYWNGAVQTNAEGKATVEVALPDNITTWVMRAVGLTPRTQVGEGTVEIVTSKPLMVRPVAPRFFVVNDKAELAANVSNGTDEAREVIVSLEADGVEITDAFSKTITVPAGGEAQATWNVTVRDVATVDLVFHAVSGNYQDASKPRLTTGPDGTLPVYRYSERENVGTGGYLANEGSRTEVLALPPNVDSSQGNLTVQIDPSLAESMRDSLEYLEHFPYECTEQTVSRFLPNVLTWNAMKQLGIENPELEERLPELVSYGLKRLYSRQLYDGGWGWWVGSSARSNTHVSAYVVWALLYAQESGFEVRQDILNDGLEYLEQQQYKQEDDWYWRWYHNRDAWILLVLAKADRANADWIDELYNDRANMNIYARAFLAQAMYYTNPNDERIATLIADLNSRAITSSTGTHWEEAYYDWWSMNTDVRATAIVLDTLVKINPDNPMLPNVVRWLMVARQGDAWETTQETAWSLIALTNWMVWSGELHPNYEYAVWVREAGNDDKRNILSTGTITTKDVEKTIVLQKSVADLLQSQMNWLTIARSSGDGMLYYTAHLDTYVPAEEVSAFDQGLRVERRYTLASCEDGPECPEVSEVQVGDVIRVDISLVSPSRRYYVVVEDPIPAGAEIIDTRLATSSDDDAEPLYYDTRPWYWWWWRWYDRSEYRDEKVVLFADYIWRGAYTYSYTMRATLAGEFRVIPTTASEMYFPEVQGRSDGRLLKIVGK